eukprot:380804-Heterocapsa_arctica.AAC.1
MNMFTAVGFELHEVEFATAQHMTLASIFDGERHCIGARGEKAWTLRGALRHGASGIAMTGRQLEVLIGHYVVEALYTRPALS